MKNQKMLENQYFLKNQNQLMLEKSVRLLEYINMYNLKRDQIIYQCPIYISEINDKDFDIEVECLEQMADIQIIYNFQRKQELRRVRGEEQKLIQQKIRKQEQQRKKQGFFGKLFGSKSKDKDKRTQSLIKKQQQPKINQSLIKSSAYLPKVTPLSNSQSQIKQSTLTYSNVLPKKQQQINSKKEQNFPSNPYANTSNIKSEQKSKQKPTSQNTQISNNKNNEIQQSKHSSSSHFNEDDLIDIDEDILDNVNESMDKNKKQMSNIIQQNQQENQSICKSFFSSENIRDSKVSRLYVEDLKDGKNGKIRKDTGRMSKRSRKLIDSDQQVQQKKQQPKQQLKPPPQIKMNKKKTQNKNDVQEPTITQAKKQTKTKIKAKKPLEKSIKKQENIYTDSTKFTNNKSVSIQKQQEPVIHKKQKSKRQQVKPIKQQLNTNKLKKKQSNNSDILNSYIQNQISRLSWISQDDILSQQSSAQLLDQLSKNQKQQNNQSRQQNNKNEIKQKQKEQLKQDSFSDVKIDWLVKIQTCELQEKLLMNRLKGRWNRPMETLNQLMKLKLSDFTKDINKDPRYMWSKPNLNFGRIIQ